MQLISFMVNKYFSISYEKFTDKLIMALSLTEVIDDFEDDDLERLEWLRDNIHKDVMVSLFKLDRNINPSKGEFKTVQNKASFKRNDWKDREKDGLTADITLSEDQMQDYLCRVVEEIDRIMCRNLRDYKEEIKIPFDVNKQDPGLDLDV